jgi:hypothetical protein
MLACIVGSSGGSPAPFDVIVESAFNGSNSRSKLRPGKIVRHLFS